MRGQDAKAVTFEQYENWRRRNGGGRDPRGGGGFVSDLCRKWAEKAISAKLDTLNAAGMLSPQQFVERARLIEEFDRVSESDEAARRAIRRHSALFNHPAVKILFPL